MDEDLEALRPGSLHQKAKLGREHGWVVTVEEVEPEFLPKGAQEAWSLDMKTECDSGLLWIQSMCAVPERVSGRRQRKIVSLGRSGPNNHEVTFIAALLDGEVEVGCRHWRSVKWMDRLLVDPSLLEELLTRGDEPEELGSFQRRLVEKARARDERVRDRGQAAEGGGAGEGGAGGADGEDRSGDDGSGRMERAG